MLSVSEPARERPIIHKTDVLVVGSGTTGLTAAHAATRNLACCAVAGQGAGVAAALSVKAGCDPDNINISTVPNELTRQGVRLH